VPVDAASKAQAEQAQLALLEESWNRVDRAGALHAGVSRPSWRGIGQRIIKRASFVSSGVQRRTPYQAAYHRGVKLIGATSHYVTELLDDGPIIEQDVGPAGRTREEVGDLVQKGSDWSAGGLRAPSMASLKHRILHYAARWCSISTDANRRGRACPAPYSPVS